MERDPTGFGQMISPHCCRHRKAAFLPGIPAKESAKSYVWKLQKPTQTNCMSGNQRAANPGKRHVRMEWKVNKRQIHVLWFPTEDRLNVMF